jgi:hypothetical protein
MKPFEATISQIIYLDFFIDRPTSEAYVGTKVLFSSGDFKIHIFFGSLFRNPSFLMSLEIPEDILRQWPTWKIS